MAAFILHFPTLVLNQTATLLYPLYASYKAVNTHSRSVGGPSELAEMETWLIYWSVFACLSLFESTFGVFWRWIPFYWELRLLFNLWLVLPQFRGATYIYVNHLHPLLSSQQGNIDQVVGQVKGRVRQQGGRLLGNLWGAAEQAQTSYTNPAPSQPQPTSGNNQMGGLFGKFAPLAAAGAAALLEKAKSGQATSSNYANLNAQINMKSRNVSGSNEGELQRTLRRTEALARRRELERQLALLEDESDESNEGPSFASPQLGGTGRRNVSGRMASALGESFDVLEKEQPPVPVGATSPRRQGDESWGSWFAKNKQ